MYVLYSTRKIITFTKKIILLPLIPVLVGLLSMFVANSSIFSVLIERSLAWKKQGYFDAGLEGRFHQSIKALQIIFESPLGIGVARPVDIGQSLNAGMWDVHGVLVVGFLGGVPAVVFCSGFYGNFISSISCKSTLRIMSHVVQRCFIH